jgi:putative FmdB family regulatory protein
MPVYSYRCTNCGFMFDQQQKFSDAALTRCPECSKKTLQKVFQPVGIVFKGSGFYSTDHRSPSGQNTRSANSTKSGENSAKSSESGEGGEKASSTASEKSSESAKSSSSDE